MNNPSSAEKMDERLAALYAALAAIPAGYLISYGELGQAAGLGRAARWVGRSLSQLPSHSQLPWHRVVRADGSLLPEQHPSAVIQQQRLREEGITVSANKVNLRAHRWHPEGCKG